MRRSRSRTTRNASNGLMYDWTQLDGRPIDAAWAQLRAANEPLSEISQNKGTSETHPALSANDEFANFEIFDTLLISPAKSKPEGSYWRDALGRGLVLAGKTGTNPYKDGAIGSGDLHSGLSRQHGAGIRRHRHRQPRRRPLHARDRVAGAGPGRPTANSGTQGADRQLRRAHRRLGRGEHARGDLCARCGARKPSPPAAAG